MKFEKVSPKIFGNEAGEDEDLEILNSYFVEKDDFEDFYSDDNKFLIVRSRKGVGKSALLRKTLYNLEKNKYAIAVYLKGSDLISFQDIQTENPYQLIYGWQQRICSRITYEIGRRLKLALDDDSITLVESAELAGFRGRNLISSLSDRLKIKLSKADISISKLITADSQALLSRYASSRNLKVWLLVDDIDATFLNRDDQRLLISTFFSACRNIVNEVHGLFLRASVRTDVWPLLGGDEALDKCEQYMVDLKWTTKETGQILKKRILSFHRRMFPMDIYYKNLDLESDHTRILKLVFRVPFPWGKSSLSPERPIQILSAGRPRWASQLCKLASKNATISRCDRIRMTDITRSMEVYGKSRLSDLYKEHSHQCKSLVNIIEAFAGSESRFTTNKLLQLLTDKIIKRFGLPQIDGLDKGTDSIYIAHFLYRIGFIHGRDDQTDDQLSFVSYDGRPHLLTSTVNLDDNMIWEIHPSYRTVLKIKERKI
ncbi:MAG: P-loop ATPase, Sll1717 family [Candidatus Helarchaeota archaeon]